MSVGFVISLWLMRLFDPTENIICSTRELWIILLHAIRSLEYQIGSRFCYRKESSTNTFNRIKRWQSKFQCMLPWSLGYQVDNRFTREKCFISIYFIRFVNRMNCPIVCMLTSTYRLWNNDAGFKKTTVICFALFILVTYLTVI